MSRKTLIVLGLTAVLVAVSFAAYQAKPSCCTNPAAHATTAKAERLRCSLTGKVVDKCCCIRREGKLHCTLANKDVASCCCTPEKAQQTAVK